jgi:hypothetical protein
MWGNTVVIHKYFREKLFLRGQYIPNAQQDNILFEFFEK